MKCIYITCLDSFKYALVYNRDPADEGALISLRESGGGAPLTKMFDGAYLCNDSLLFFREDVVPSKVLNNLEDDHLQYLRGYQ